MLANTVLKAIATRTETGKTIYETSNDDETSLKQSTIIGVAKPSLFEPQSETTVKVAG